VEETHDGDVDMDTDVDCCGGRFLTCKF
jgi:hypothetical protein